MPDQRDFSGRLHEKLEIIRSVLLERNEAHGESVFEPVRVFSAISPVARLAVRIDGDLARIKRGNTDPYNEDALFDLAAKIILLLILGDK